MADIGYEQLLSDLNHPQCDVRLAALLQLKAQNNHKKTPNSLVNNHIHTIYSFSPYSPAKAVWMAYNAGLITAGIMDHDSIGGASEFIEAGRIINIATTIGVECRADFRHTALKGKRINNPDQKSVAYVALHGIPHQMIDQVSEFFGYYRNQRNQRNRAMVDNLNSLFAKQDIKLDFDQDIVPLSMANEGGSITERHILFALSQKLIGKFGKGEALVKYLRYDLKLDFSRKLTDYLLDPNNQYYTYDLLGVLKGDLVEAFYIPASNECPPIDVIKELAVQTGCILAYAYLGDVGESVTGDKKAQKFEDEYLEQLFTVLTKLGFNAVTYMPSRNTMGQLTRVKELCRKHQLLEISGEDINSPRQSFVCNALAKPEFANLTDSTWALIGHEQAATKNITQGMFTDATIAKYRSLEERISVYKAIGQSKLNNDHVCK